MQHLCKKRGLPFTWGLAVAGVALSRYLVPHEECAHNHIDVDAAPCEKMVHVCFRLVC